MQSRNFTTDTAKVYLDYPEEIGPPPPLPGWTRFVCLADTHSRVFEIPPGDVLVHAGDLTNHGYPSSLVKAIDWLKSLPHKVKIVVGGNHDLALDPKTMEPEVLEYMQSADQCTFDALHVALKGEAARQEGFHYLEHQAICVTAGNSGRKWRVYASPSSPRHLAGAFQYGTIKEAKDIYNSIPNDTEIVVTHTPAYNILDETKRGKQAGCLQLRDRLLKLEDCKLHVCGHIHEAQGAALVQDGIHDFISVNAAMARISTCVVVDLKN